MSQIHSPHKTERVAEKEPCKWLW